MKVAVIGAGNWGKNLVRTLFDLGSLGAIVEPDVRQRDLLAPQFPRTPIFADYNSFLKTDIQVVAIATPVSTHFEIAKSALLSGKDVFVEKPMTLSVTEAEELSAIAKRESRVLMVGHLLLYQPAIRWIANFLKEGGLGKLFSLHQDRLNLGRARSTENALWSLGVHDAAVLLDLVGETPNQVEAYGHCALQPGIEDDVHVRLQFPSGVQAFIHASWLWPEKSRKLTLIGEKGMLVFNELKQAVTLHKKRIDSSLNSIDEGEEIVFSHASEPLKIELEHFLQCVKDRKTPLSSGEKSIEVVRVMAMAHAQLNQKEGNQVEKRNGVVAHETAYIDEGAVVGNGTRVWHFSHVSEGAIIGQNCSLGQNVFVARKVKIGNRVKIQNNVSLYEGVILEDDVFCGPSMVFTNVRTPRSAFPRNTPKDYHETRVQKGASIGANATILCGTTIGRSAFIGAGAVVTKDVPPFGLMVGVPARRIGWACECGLALVFKKDVAQCGECGRTYERTSDSSIRLTNMEPSHKTQRERTNENSHS